jgi:HEAT repeat protein
MRSLAAGGVLAEYAWSSDPLLAAFCAEALAKLNDPNAVDDLVELTHHASSQVQVAAVRGLAQLDGPVAVGTLEGLVTAPAGVDPTVRGQAVEALGMVGRESSISVLVEAMQIHPAVREDAGRALGKLTGLDYGDSAQAWSAWYQARFTTRQQVPDQRYDLPPLLEIPEDIAEKLAPLPK